MKLLFIGDIVGRAGRDAVKEHLPGLRKDLALDCVITNAENAAHGFGITEKICAELYEAGVDIITLGNHAWDQREVIPYLERDKTLVRPINYPPGTPGRGVVKHKLPGGKQIVVINVMGRLFMELLDNPFFAVDQALQQYKLGHNVDAVVLDVHAEATSEKMAMGHYFDGRVSFVVGTHTHIPTADAMILGGGTAYQSDAGMSGSYDSVIGMDKKACIDRFIKKPVLERMTPAKGEGTLSGVYVVLNDKGLAEHIEPVRLGGRLIQARPGAVAS